MQKFLFDAKVGLFALLCGIFFHKLCVGFESNAAVGEQIIALISFVCLLICLLNSIRYRLLFLPKWNFLRLLIRDYDLFYSCVSLRSRRKRSSMARVLYHRWIMYAFDRINRSLSFILINIDNYMIPKIMYQSLILSLFE